MAPVILTTEDPHGVSFRAARAERTADLQAVTLANGFETGSLKISMWSFWGGGDAVPVRLCQEYPIRYFRYPAGYDVK